MTTPELPLAAITGARGWLGGSLTRFFRERGWATRGMVRHPGPEEVLFRLGEAVAPAALEGVAALVHCAYDFTGRDWASLEAANVRGTEQLFRAAAEAGVPKLVYISTMSAFPGARSLYGRVKLAAEEVASRYGALILRPGLITGDEPGGMVGALVKQVQGARLVPLIAGEAVLYTVHERDLAELIFRYAEGEIPLPKGPVVTAHPEPLPFARLLRELARREGRKPIFVPIPWRAVWLGLRAAEAVGVKLGFRSDSVLSLANQDPHPDFSGAEGLGFRPRRFSG